jgi:Ca2+-binding RTX toxin-like protein
MGGWCGSSRWAAAGAAAILLSFLGGGYPSASAASPSANNGLIASSWGYQLRAMNPDGTSLHYLASTGDTATLRYSSPAWSPDGHQIAFERTGDIAVADWRGNGIHPLTDTAAPVYESDPAWSPDGTQIAFARNEAIWVMDADGTGQHQVTTMCCNGYPTWSPDGGTIAFSSYRDGSWQIYARDLAAGEPAVQLTESAGMNLYPDWSPDGTQIVFTSGRRDNNADIWVMNSDGVEETPLTALPESEEYPAWSPDGQQVVYEHAASPAVVNRDGSGLHTLDQFGSEPDWQPLPACTVSGTEASDSLVGTDAADVLCGLGGDDTITGAGGDDVVIGGPGSDAVCFGAGATGAQVNLLQTTAAGDGSDLILMTENACGTDGDDVLYGNEVGNSMSGGAGDDVIDGDLGPDALDGGVGNDTVTFDRSGGVDVDLGAGTADTSSGTTDTVAGFEDVVGSRHSDYIVGDVGANRLDGGPGGYDNFHGGPGDDTMVASPDGGAADYFDAPTSVDVNLETGVATGAGRDTLVGMTGAFGSTYDDVIRGAVAGVGSDLSGGGGDDLIVSNLPDSELRGGDGNDTLRLSGLPTAVTLNMAQGRYTAQGNWVFLATDFEHVIGTSFNDVIIGTVGPNRLSSGAGADVISPGGGDDLVHAGPGTDQVSFVGAARSVIVDLAERYAVGEGSDALSGVEDVVGSPFADSISGNAGSNRLDGGFGGDDVVGARGADVVIGGNGPDDLFGGAGSDQVRARDSSADRVDGGLASDICIVDTSDLVRRCP